GGTSAYAPVPGYGSPCGRNGPIHVEVPCGERQKEKPAAGASGVQSANRTWAPVVVAVASAPPSGDVASGISASTVDESTDDASPDEETTVDDASGIGPPSGPWIAPPGPASPELVLADGDVEHAPDNSTQIATRFIIPRTSCGERLPQATSG